MAIEQKGRLLSLWEYNMPQVHLLTDLWKEARLAKPVEEHIKELIEIYQTGAGNPAPLVGADEGSVEKLNPCDI